MHEDDICEDLAKQLVGNWKKFESFVWYDKPEEDSDNWTIVNTHHRDSGLLELSNAFVIHRRLDKWPDDIRFERHNHYAVGWIECVVIKIYKNIITKEVTDAFRAYCELYCAMENYSILDESHYSNMEYEAAIKAIEDNGVGLISDVDIPSDWPYSVYSWLWNNDQREVENIDDQGAYPSKDSIERALVSLGHISEKDNNFEGLDNDDSIIYL